MLQRRWLWSDLILLFPLLWAANSSSDQEKDSRGSVSSDLARDFDPKTWQDPAVLAAMAGQNVARKLLEEQTDSMPDNRNLEQWKALDYGKKLEENVEGKILANESNALLPPLKFEAEESGSGKYLFDLGPRISASELEQEQVAKRGNTPIMPDKSLHLQETQQGSAIASSAQAHQQSKADDPTDFVQTKEKKAPLKFEAKESGSVKYVVDLGPPISEVDHEQLAGNTPLMPDNSLYWQENKQRSAIADESKVGTSTFNGKADDPTELIQTKSSESITNLQEDVEIQHINVEESASFNERKNDVEESASFNERKNDEGNGERFEENPVSTSGKPEFEGILSKVADSATNNSAEYDGIEVLRLDQKEATGPRDEESPVSTAAEVKSKEILELNATSVISPPQDFSKIENEVLKLDGEEARDAHDEESSEKLELDGGAKLDAKESSVLTAEKEQAEETLAKNEIIEKLELDEGGESESSVLTAKKGQAEEIAKDEIPENINLAQKVHLIGNEEENGNAILIDEKHEKYSVSSARLESEEKGKHPHINLARGFSLERSDLRKNQSKEFEDSIDYSDLRKNQSKDFENSIDYQQLVEELSDLPSKLHDTADQVAEVAEHLLPRIRKLSHKSKGYFNLAHQQITERVTPIIGHEYASIAAIIISYSILLIPILFVIFMLDKIRAIFSLDKILLFINIYLITSVAILLFMNLVLGTEPLQYLQKSAPSVFIFLQLLQGNGYFVYLLLYSFNLITVCSGNKIRAKVGALMQWSIVLCIALHYYVAVFHRAMARKAPRIGSRAYVLYLLGLAWLLLFIRLKRGKKEYNGKDTRV